MSREASVESIEDAIRYYYWVEHRTRTMVHLYISYLTAALSATYVLVWVFIPHELPGPEMLILPLWIVGGLQVTGFLAEEKIRNRFFSQMAASFGLTLSASSDMKTVSGHLFNFGHSRRISEVFEGTHSGHRLRLYTFMFANGNGKSEITHYLRVFETDCLTELPEIMVRPFSVKPDGQNWRPKGTRPLQLEGLFNEQFEVYVPEGMEIEALQVLEPHHMDMLMHQYRDVGFYTHGTKLYLFTDAPMPSTRTGFAGLMSLIDTIYDALVPEFHAVSGDVTALREAFARGK